MIVNNVFQEKITDQLAICKKKTYELETVENIL